MISTIHRIKYRSLPVCSQIFHFDFVNKNFPSYMLEVKPYRIRPIAAHNYEEPEIIHILDGELDLSVGRRSFRLGKGETALICPHVTHSANFVPGCDTLEYCYLIFGFGILSGCGKDVAEEITALRNGSKLFQDKLTGAPSEKIGRNMLAIERLLFRQTPTAAGELEACACLSNIMSAILNEGLIICTASETRRRLHRACRALY